MTMTIPRKKHNTPRGPTFIHRVLKNDNVCGGPKINWKAQRKGVGGRLSVVVRAGI